MSIPRRENRTQSVTPDLLREPGLIDKLKDIIQARGYAGEVRPPLIAYFPLTSRLLDRPLNLNFVAPSAAGKNRAVNAALELMPTDAAYYISAGSQKSLIYSTESFEHRVVIFAEADSIPDEGSAASAMRALAEDNKLVYVTTDRDSANGKLESRTIRKEGPTGLITTSTKKLAHQLNTRVLEVSVNDGPAQTRAVILAEAQAVMPGVVAARPDVAPFVAAQEWLSRHGKHRVFVPFAEALSALVPTHELRIRRDFRQLLTMVQTSALLHQAQRECRDDGIIATLDDYRIARRLLSTIFDAISADGLTTAIRDTVEAVEPGEAIMQADLVDRLGLSKAAVSDRVRTAVEKGWLIREGNGRGRTAILRRGEPLPDEGTALPAVESVRVKVIEQTTEHRPEHSKVRGFRPKNARTA